MKLRAWNGEIVDDAITRLTPASNAGRHQCFERLGNE